MPIAKDMNKTKKITTFKITGMISFDEFRKFIIKHYKEEPSDYVIFDLREAGGTGEQFSHERITQLVDLAEDTRRSHEKGKTAMVVDKDVFYGLCRMVEAYMHSSKIKYRAFRRMEEAMQWLEEDR